MAANFYLSTHANHHLHPRSALALARIDDLKYATEEELAWIEIWSGSVIQKICKRLQLRQQVIATAITFFRRFYLRNAYCDTDPPLVAAACCYVASKAEETPLHVKVALSEARVVFSEMGVTSFSRVDTVSLAEMEFYLVEELDFHLIVFHPYRSLVQLCGRDGGLSEPGGKKRREAMLEMDDSALQMAWFVINDSFRSSLCLVHPPHLIALAAIYLALALHPPPQLTAYNSTVAAAAAAAAAPTTTAVTTAPPPPSSSTAKPPPAVGGRTDPITFLSHLDIDMSLILEIVQDLISLYELWHNLEVPDSQAAAKVGSRSGTPQQAAGGAGKSSMLSADERVWAILMRIKTDRIKDLQEAERQKQAGNWKK